MRVFLLCIACWVVVGGGAAVAQWQLRIESSEAVHKILKPYFPNRKYDSQWAVRQDVKVLVEILQQSGYFQAYAEPLASTDSLTHRVKIREGAPFQWAYLKPGNLDPVLQAASGYRETLFLQQPFRYSDFQQLVDNCLAYSEDHGFPFASVRLTQVEIDQQEISATLHYQSGPLIRFGELNVPEIKDINPEFLEAYLGIRTGTIYSEKKVAQIVYRLQLLPYLSLNGPVETRFQNEVADIYLPLSVLATNQVDGVLSVAPDAGYDERKVLLTGEANILLRNLAKSGKTFALHWQRLQFTSQQLSVSYDHPNLLRSSFGAGFDFNLLKEDTLFLNRKANLRLSYLAGKNHRLTTFGDWRSSRLTGQYESAGEGVLSPLADVSVRGGGLRYEWSQVDHPLFPRWGYTLSVMARSGRKTVSFWTSDDPQNDQLNLQTQVSPQWAGEFSFAQYYMLGTTVGVFHRIRGAGLLDKNIFLNELYRLGGLTSLRGFTDNLFFASHYALSTLEIRWLLEPENSLPSYVFAFYDQAWMQQRYQQRSSSDIPLGTGVGISIRTRAGLFSLAYALGKSENQMMTLRASKVHFGYISRF